MRRLVVLLSFLFFLVSGLAAQNDIRLTTGEFPPFMGEKLFRGGVVTDIVTKVLARSGFTVQYGYFPWARSMALARTGEWDGSVYWLKTPEREKDFYFSDQPLYRGNYALYFARTLPTRPQTIGDLIPLHIGVTRGYTYGAEFEALRAAGKLNTEESGTELANFQKLLAGRIDVFLIGTIAGPALLRQSFSPEEMSRLDSVPRFLPDQGGYLILSRTVAENKARIERFDRAFRQFVDSGDYGRLLADFDKGVYER